MILNTSSSLYRTISDVKPTESWLLQFCQLWAAFRSLAVPTLLYRGKTWGFQGDTIVGSCIYGGTVWGEWASIEEIGYMCRFWCLEPSPTSSPVTASCFMKKRKFAVMSSPSWRPVSSQTVSQNKPFLPYHVTLSIWSQQWESNQYRYLVHHSCYD